MPDEKVVEGTWDNPIVPEPSKEPSGSEQTATQEPVASTEITADAPASPDIDALLKEEEKSAVSAIESLGITNENAAAILEKAKNFDATVAMLQNNPDLFLNEVEKLDPKSLAKLLDKATDRFIERNGGTSDEQPKGEKDTEIASLKTRLAELEKDKKAQEAEKIAQANAATAQEIQNKLDARVLEIFGKVPQLDEADQAGVRSRIMDSIGQDKASIAKIVSGDLSPVLKHAKTILEDHFSKRKASVEKRKTAQQKVTENASTERTTAAAATAGEGKVPDWEAAIQGVASALSKGRK